MNQVEINKVILSVVILLIIYLFSNLLKITAKRTQQKFKIRKSRYFAIRRFFTTASILLMFFSLILIWNVNIKNVWVSLTGIMALVAIAFFAVWSLVGNILAGIIIYFTSPFKIEDTIEVMPDGICGTVLAVNTFYTVLLDTDGSYISVPNSLFFQKYIRLVKKQDKNQHSKSLPSE
ncbi:MAG: mechanosensitive ion channel family protein [Kiritimatiellae bacterium]|jgi:MscS family membrane protein|nr:mechanosensitive ion channel family protein [Kiritimatiellia bacterium]